MPRKWLAFCAVACGTFMATLDASVVNIALSTFARELTSDLAHVKWVVISYFLVITCLLLPFGRISDIVGPKKIFGMGFIIFTIGSVLCGISNALLPLVIFRIVQAVGAAMLMANGPAIITEAFPSRERGAALGNLAVIVSIGLISGPSVGGLLIMGLGWRSMFLINLPVGILGAYLTYKYVQADGTKGSKYPFDWPGAILQSIILVLIIFFFDPPDTSILTEMQISIPHWLIAVLLPFFIFAFVQWEKRCQAPVFDLSLLENRTFWTANLAAFFMFAAYSSIAVLMPYFLEQVLLYGTDTAGLLMTAIPFIILVVAPISGRLSDFLGSKELCIAGSVVETATLLALSGVIGLGIHRGMSEFGITLALCATGLGLALFQSPNNNAIMGAVPRHKLGTASALIATIRNLGLVIGAGLATGSFSWQFQKTHDFLEALHFTFLISAGIGACAILTSFGKSKGPHWK